MACSIVHPSRVDYLFGIHCISIKSSNFLWCHISVVRDWAHVTHVIRGHPLAVGTQAELYWLLISIIRGQFSPITFIPYLLLMLSLVIGILILDTESSTVGCIVHLLPFIIDCCTFGLEKVCGITPLVLVH